MTDPTPVAEQAGPDGDDTPDAAAARTVGELARAKLKAASQAPAPTRAAEVAVTADQGDRNPRAGLHARLMASVKELRFVSEQPSSLHDVVALAARGEWTAAEAGPVRALAQIHATAIQVPLLTVAYFLAWSCRSPARLWTVFALVNTLGSALNTIPVINLVIPDWLTWGFWPPFCWIF